MLDLLRKVHELLTTPAAIFFILHSRRIHPAYRMTFVKKMHLGWRMFLNRRRIPTAGSFRGHLAMALKLFETPPDQAGDVIECGTFKGGSAANLSLVCRITGRKLRIFDSFQGLPAGEPGDREAAHYGKGDFAGSLDEVRRNIERYGAIECCEFIQGWYNETLPRLDRPVLLAYLDVDLEASLDTCVRCIWPHLVDRGYMFTDECPGMNYVALFFSERWWREHFNREPPGLIGAGTGLPLGNYYIGPFDETPEHPLQRWTTGAYTRKDLTAVWTYYPNR